jgi:hypothetical protein
VSQGPHDLEIPSYLSSGELLTSLRHRWASGGNDRADAAPNGPDATLSPDARAIDAAPSCDPDSFENDSTFQSARVPDFNMVDVVSYADNTICDGDSDWFYVYLFATETIEVKATFEQMGVLGDLDILIHSAENDEMTPTLLTNCSEENPAGCSADTGQSRTSGENFSYTALTTGPHYFEMRPWMDAENSYAICFALYGASCP